tara:strand:- start:673 stop:969 length:297 start_codon:yes stop_codon:yes gene_type:complete
MTTRPRNPQLRLLPLPEGYEPPFDLETGVDELKTADEMIHWLRELVRDYWEGEEEWTNDTLDLFLEGLASALADLPEDQQGVDWPVLARALLAATVRE